MIDDQEKHLHTVATENIKSILAARQRAEQELSRSLSLLNATIESATDGFLVTKEDGSVMLVNNNFLHMWQVPRETIEGKTYYEVMSILAKQFVDPDSFTARAKEIALSTVADTYDVLITTDGRVIEGFTKPQTVDGAINGRVWNFREITDQRKHEESLRDEKRVFETLYETGSALASELDLDKLLQTITDASTKLCGAQFGAFFYNSKNDEGDTYLLYTLSGAPREAFAGFGQPRSTALFGPTFRGEETIRSDNIQKDPRFGKMSPHYGMPRGHLPVCSYLAVPVISRTGDVFGGLFFGHAEVGKFTERSERIIKAIVTQAAVAVDNARLYEREKSARSTSERLGEVKDVFLANLSHELRTPLSAILGWTQVLKYGAHNPTDLLEGLEAIERNARVQIQLIEDLLDSSRISSGKVRLDIQPLSPISFIEAALETVRPAAESKGIRIVKILDSRAGPISGDPGRLQQILWNLLSNAIKFTPKGGKVQIVLERINSHIEISVTDTGIGIKPDLLPHIFERFQQGDSTATKQYVGLGLGLAIAKQLSDLHGGTIKAYSQGEGKGSVFTLHLPLTALKHIQHEKRSHPQTFRNYSMDYKSTDLSGVTILLVDDDQDARDVIQRVLTACSAKVVIAESGADALLYFKTATPDILISDIGMPGMDGYDLLQQVRALDEGKTVSAIALTAFARSEDRTKALRAGFLSHIAKPVEPVELVATVAAFIRRKSDL